MRGAMRGTRCPFPRGLRPGLPPSAAGRRRGPAGTEDARDAGRTAEPRSRPLSSGKTPRAERGRGGLSLFFPQRVRVTLARCSGCWWPWPVAIAPGTGWCLNPDNVTCKPAGERTCYFFPKTSSPVSVISAGLETKLSHALRNMVASLTKMTHGGVGRGDPSPPGASLSCSPATALGLPFGSAQNSWDSVAS